MWFKLEPVEELVGNNFHEEVSNVQIMDMREKGCNIENDFSSGFGAMGLGEQSLQGSLHMV
ncbi:hypothetical protein Taro_030344, partial [Colocasia esculenta]|nr:hypothetical protein [Colocasia esculenta]